jgi:signal transduction histidine kinase
MSAATLLSLLLAVAAIVAAVWFFRMAQLERARTLAFEEESKRQAGSQAQVMHTTKLASLGQMIAGVAHELNTPLGFVKSNVDVCRELLVEYHQLISKVQTNLLAASKLNLDDPNVKTKLPQALKAVAERLAANTSVSEVNELLTDSRDGLEQLAKLVRNLKGFARVDSDGMDLFDPNEAIESALTIAQHELRDRITVIRELNPVPRIKAVPSQINQVLLNLITNAAQAMDDGGKLTLRSQRSGDYAQIEVEDTGHGIPDEVLPKIFDPFFTTKAVGEGTGLGLSIVHKIVQSHGGSVNVRSYVGQGTTFIVNLPIDHASLKGSGRGEARPDEATAK